MSVAVKTMKEGTMDADKFLEEANVMKRLKHPHILQLKAICSREVGLERGRSTQVLSRYSFLEKEIACTQDTAMSQ